MPPPRRGPPMWQAPADVINAARRPRLGYRDGPTFAEARTQRLPLSPGIEALRDHILALFGNRIARVYAPPRSRANIQPTDRLDIHGSGRALDFMIPRAHYGQAAWGDPIANYLVLNADRLGIQTVIWNRRIWVATRPGQGVFRDYTLASAMPHDDHVHVELTPEAGLLGRVPNARGAAATIAASLAQVYSTLRTAPRTVLAVAANAQPTGPGPVAASAGIEDVEDDADEAKHGPLIIDLQALEEAPEPAAAPTRPSWKGPIIAGTLGLLGVAGLVFGTRD